MKHSFAIRIPLLAGVLAALILAPAARAEDETNPLQALRAYSESQSEAPSAASATPPAAEQEIRTGSLAPSSLPTDMARNRMLPLIEKAARDHDIPPALLDAVVRVESRYNPNVKNHGAIGLMQIKLATARGIGFGGDAATLAKPETNLQWGAKYLARAYQLSGGDTCLTLARYQSGHRLDRLGPSSKAYCAKVRTVLAQLN